MLIAAAGRTDIAPILDLLGILTPGGAVVGAMVGFAIAASSTAELIGSVLAGAGIGGVLGSLFAFVIAAVDLIA